MYFYISKTSVQNVDTKASSGISSPLADDAFSAEVYNR